MTKRVLSHLGFIFLLCSLGLTSLVSSDYANMYTMSNYGSVNLNQPLKLVFQTDFEDVTKNDEHSLNLTLNNYLYTQGEEGARMWIEGLDRITPGITPHSGSRCLGMEVTNISLSRRAQLDVYIGQYAPLTGDEHYFKAWYFLAPDWQLNTSVQYNYYSIANPYSTLPNFSPLIEIELHMTSDPTVFDLAVTYRDGGWYPEFAVFRNFPWMALRGRWFPIEWYVKSHDTNGILRVWVNGTLICDKSDVALPKNDGPYIVVGKVYYGSQDLIQKQLWLDDLEIYGTP